MLKLGKMLIQVSIAGALACSLAAAQSQTAAKPPVVHHAAAPASDHALLSPGLLHARAPAEYDVRTVSYTHLDVYKRQGLSFSGNTNRSN